MKSVIRPFLPYGKRIVKIWSKSGLMVESKMEIHVFILLNFFKFFSILLLLFNDYNFLYGPFDY